MEYTPGTKPQYARILYEFVAAADPPDFQSGITQPIEDFLTFLFDNLQIDRSQFRGEQFIHIPQFDLFVLLRFKSDSSLDLLCVESKNWIIVTSNSLKGYFTSFMYNGICYCDFDLIKAFLYYAEECIKRQ